MLFKCEYEFEILQKIIFEKVVVASSNKCCLGNMGFELNLQNYTSITCIGEVDCLKDTSPKEILFTDIPKSRGLIRMTQKLNVCYY